nr:hypothetical protein [Clostridia bacterium]
MAERNQNVNSYNATYPLDYYEIGSVYSFYTWYPDLIVPSDPSYGSQFVEQYGPILDSLVDEPGIGKDERISSYTRFLGVVVEKSPEKNTITVLLKNSNNDYSSKKFVAAWNPVYTDSKEGKTASARIGTETTTPVRSNPTGPVEKSGKTGPTEKGGKTGPTEKA